MAIHGQDTSLNPFEVDLVLEKILVNIKSKRLLKLRLVNRKWNSHIISILRTRNLTISLDGSNISEYLRLLKERRDDSACDSCGSSSDEEAGNNQGIGIPPRTPTHLNFSIRYGKYANSLNNIVEGTNQLIELFGRCCIHSFTYHCVVRNSEDLEPDEWIRVLKLIQQLSPGLHNLFICVQAKHEDFTIAETLGSPYFPQLRTLHYGEAHINPIILTQIVNGSPNLKTLIIRRRLFDRSINVQKITSDLSSIRSLSLTHLQELKIDAIDFLNVALIPLQFQHLQKVKLCIETGVYEVGTDFISTFLKNKCPDIISLEFEFLPKSNSFVNEFPINVPFLPKLTHAGYSVNWRHCIHEEPSFIKLDNFRIASQKFPNLQSITTNLGSCVYLSTEFDPFQQYQLQEDQEVDWYDVNQNINISQFPSVSTLNFNISFNIDFTFQPDHIGFPISLEESINQLHLLYPNVRKLHVDNQIPSLDDYKEEKLVNIMKVLLEEINGLEELEISNYFDDWLCEAFSKSLTEESDLINNIQSLKIIKLPPLSRNYRYPIVDLLKLLYYIPNLREVHLDAEFLKDDVKTSNEVQAQMTEIIRKGFPEFKVQII